MAVTPSTMLPLGTKAPEFKLVDARTDKLVTLSDHKSEAATVIMFICNHCPFVKHIHEELLKVANDYMPKGVSFIAINSNDPTAYPEDDFNHMKQTAQQYNYPFPYLFDETQQVAKDYQAACTPDFYLFDMDLLCVYRGQFDDARPGNNIPVTGSSLRAALDNILSNKPIDTNQKPSQGCNIKWRDTAANP